MSSSHPTCAPAPPASGFDANRIASDIARLDSTREVDHASGWHDQGGGDVRSLHVFVRPFRLPRGRDGRVVAVPENGGYSLRVDGHVWGTGSFGYRRYQTVGALARAFTRLHVDEIGPAVRRGPRGDRLHRCPTSRTSSTGC